MATHPSRKDFIAKEWLEFSVSISPGARDTFVDAMKIAFYAGVMSMHTAIVHAIDVHGPVVAADFLQRTNAELEQFSATLCQDEEQEKEISH